jgi:hypothetical protein
MLAIRFLLSILEGRFWEIMMLVSKMSRLIDPHMVYLDLIKVKNTLFDTFLRRSYRY